MKLDEIIAKASRCVLQDAIGHPPCKGTIDGIRRKAEVIDLLDWRFSDGILIGDHHADTEHPHSIRMTVRRNVDGLLLICTTDGQVDLTLMLSDSPGDWITEGDLRNDPSASIVKLLHVTSVLLTPSMTRATMDQVHDWVAGVATLCSMAAETDMGGEMTLTMATPFGHTEIQSSFFGSLPRDRRRKAYDVIEALKPHTPCGMSVAFDPARPERIRMGRMAISRGVPDGVLERMRVIQKLKSMMPEDVEIPL